MNARAAAILIAVLLPFAARAATDTPLLDYAQELSFSTVPDEMRLREEVEEDQHEVSKYPVPEPGCARSLGATRFVQMYRSLGFSLSRIGDYAGSVEAYTKALYCGPRESDLLASLGAELMHLGKYDEARATLKRAIAIDDDSLQLIELNAQLDFIQERWADAVANLRRVAQEEEEDDRAAYFQCFLWLAQKRAGVVQPELVRREDTLDWPREVLDTLRGDLSEEELRTAVENEEDEERRREILTEALFYVGENRLADGDVQNARRYFAAAVNLKVLYFVEYHMARAELARVRAESVPNP